MHYLRQVVIVSLAADPAILQLQLGGATEGTLPSGLPPRPVERQLYDCPRLAGEAARHLEPHVAIGLEWAPGQGLDLGATTRFGGGRNFLPNGVLGVEGSDLSGVAGRLDLSLRGEDGGTRRIRERSRASRK
jgi:hypothetical protein